MGVFSASLIPMHRETLWKDFNWDDIRKHLLPAQPVAANR